MNLKKIIKEEMDGFDWADGVGEFEPHIGTMFKAGTTPDTNRFQPEVYEVLSINRSNETMTIRWKNERGGFQIMDDYPLSSYWQLVDENRLKIVFSLDEDFDWTKPVEPFYWDAETNPLKLGDCIIDKLDSTSTNWVIEKLGQTFSGTKTITVSDGEQTKILNRELFEKDLTTGRYSFCSDFVTEDFNWAEDWVEDTPTVGDKYYFDYGMDFDPVLVRVIGVIRNDIVRFKVLDYDFVQYHTEMFYDEEYGWDPTDSMSLEGFMEQAKKVTDLKEDFNWVKDVQTWDLGACNWVIKTNDEKEFREVEEFLFNNGWNWYGEEDYTPTDYQPKFNHFFADECERNTFDSSGLQLVLKRMPNHKIYEWSDIKGLVDED